MKTRPFQTIGVELPRPGNGTRHETFSFVLQRSGRFFSLARPLPSGPRHPGQFAAETDAVRAHQSQETAQHRHVVALYPHLSVMDHGTK